MEIPKKIKDEIWDYCRLNDITDIDGFMVNMLQQGYNVEKYGNAPVKLKQKEPEVIEKEVIKEVEKIVEVEKRVEIPVEKIVEVEKIIEVPTENTEYIDELLNKVKSLESDNKELKLNLEQKNNSDDIDRLLNKIKNLELELELEKNRHKGLPKPKRIEEPKKGRLNNIIKWVSKEKDEDIYDED